MVENTGRIILRLPPYHCELNPIKLTWPEVKDHVAKNHRTFKLADVKNLVVEGISKVTLEDWKKCVGHLEKEVEKKM